MRGILYIEWDHMAEPPKSRYYGWGQIDGKRVRLYGDIEQIDEHRRVKIIVNDQMQQPERKKP